MCAAVCGQEERWRVLPGSSRNAKKTWRKKERLKTRSSEDQESEGECRGESATKGQLNAECDVIILCLISTGLTGTRLWETEGGRGRMRKREADCRWKERVGVEEGERERERGGTTLWDLALDTENPGWIGLEPDSADAIVWDFLSRLRFG